MGLFHTMKEPIFLKESSSADRQLEALTILRQQASPPLQKRIEQEIKLVQAGIFGENQIMFELKNSHMPMAVLHDLYFEKDGLTAQIDFFIFTRGRNFILECKNLIGNISIDHGGNFKRLLEYGRYQREEGLYSPITQNQRHLELVKQILLGTKGNIFTRSMLEKHFPETYRSVVVLANPKTVLDARYAKKEVKEQVIRADQLIAYIKRVNGEQGTEFVSERQMMHGAQFFLEKSTDNPTDYLEKYRTQWAMEGELAGAEPGPPPMLGEKPGPDTPPQPHRAGAGGVGQILCPRCGAPMVKRTATKGPNAGKGFYGCSNFPRCRGTMNMECSVE